MKYLLFVLLLLPCLVGAADLTVILEDSVIAADSTGRRYDTVYTPSMYIGDFDYLSFYSEVQPWQIRDTDFTDDVFYVNFQHSPDGKRWYTSLELDTFTTTDSSYAVDILSRDDSVFGNWGRGMFIHTDSMTTGDGGTGIKDSVFYKICKLWIFGN